MSARVTITKDRVNEVVGSIAQLVSAQVLVGIPESTAPREGEPINNASLGYIHEHGAPGANIPARPFLVPGARKSIAQYVPHLEGAVKAALDANHGGVKRELESAGIIAAASAKRELTSGNFVPLKPATIAARRRSRDTASRRESEERYLGLIRGGMSPGEAQAAVGIKPLVNTAQLLRAVTSVVRKAK